MMPQTGPNAPLLFPFAIDVHLSERPFKLGFKAVIRNIQSEPHQDLTDPTTHTGRMWVLFRDGTPIARGITGRRDVEAMIPAQFFEVGPDQSLMLQLLTDSNKNARVKVTLLGHGEFVPGQAHSIQLVSLPSDAEVRAQLVAQQQQQ